MIYVCDTPWTDSAGRQWFHLWADSSDEAVAALYACGGNLSQRNESANAWEAYSVTPEQFASALSLGITITDRFGPAEWCGKRDKNDRILRLIQEARTAGCVKRSNRA